ncbi:hypothetical protein F441_03876, partial [Phytophthora nicotianae CJ01A1]
PATSNGDLFVVSDDASSVRNMVHRVFQDRVSTKQDPCHNIARFHGLISRWTNGFEFLKALE